MVGWGWGKVCSVTFANREQGGGELTGGGACRPVGLGRALGEKGVEGGVASSGTRARPRRQGLNCCR